MAAAAVLPNANDPIHKPKPAAPAAAATTRRVSRATMTILVVFLAVNFAVNVRRVHDDRGAVAFVCFAYLNLALLICALRRAEAARPLGSPAHGRAKLAVWLLTTTLSAAFAWKIGDVLPLVPAIVLWVVAAATVAAGSYVLFLYDEEKGSASLIMPGCEKDEGCHFDQSLNKYKIEALTTPAEMTTSKKNLTAAEVLTVVTSAQGA